MSFFLLGLALLLAVHLLVSSGLSLLVAGVVPLVGGRLRQSHAAGRARVFFALGMLPALGGLAVALGLVLPAWLVHEPRDSGEGAGPLLLVLAVAGAALVLGRLGRAAQDQVRTLLVVDRWTSRGRDVQGLALPATRFAHDFPLAGLAGLFRPRLLLADALIRALDEDELAAVVAHEQAHADARDNLRQLLLQATPDLLALIPAGTRLRADFEEAAEAAADRRAAAKVAPLTLARALLKVAALVPPDRRLEVSFAALHREGSLFARVRALVEGDERPSPRPHDSLRERRFVGVAALVATPLLIAALLTLLPAVHGLLEGLVHALG
jgi:Zn-dependent protease with chaperone function